jgi:predicted RNA-binding protein with PIN domain
MPNPGSRAGNDAAARPRIVVDAMNVIGTRPDGWWRDRPAAIRRLVGRLQALAASGEPRAITVAIDGRPVRGLPEGTHDGVEVLYAARDGANAADDRIAEYVRAYPDPSQLEVVTSDRMLVHRVRIHGATVTGPQELLARLDALDAPSRSDDPPRQR